MKPTIALFLHQPKCSVQSGNGVMNALDPHYKFKIFTKHGVEDDFFDDVDIICFPGGVGDSDSYDSLLKNHEKRIRKFVADGGYYLGICMGAYWAGHHYLNITDVKAEQYIKRPNTDTHRPHAKAMEVIWEGNKEKMFFYDGCALIGSKFETVATYPNGDVMALIQNRIGLIGCHPESQPHWYNSYSWMKKHYHNGNHHKLLLEFVDKLMEK